MRIVVAALMLAVGICFCVVGLLQLYMAGIATIVGTRAFEMSNWDLAKMGFDLLAFSFGLGVLALWTAK